uniref:Uncharacterized protein n=1 Tax=Anguilla anguilla TaxID=7936 RepID=A0A0E9TP58_ANGAN
MVTGYTQVQCMILGKRETQIPPSSMAKQFYFTL